MSDIVDAARVWVQERLPWQARHLERAYDWALELDPGASEALVLAAELAGRAGDFAGAQTLLDQVVDRYPNSPYAEVAVLNRAILAVRGGRAADIEPAEYIGPRAVDPHGGARAARAIGETAHTPDRDAAAPRCARRRVGQQSARARLGVGIAGFAAGDADIDGGGAGRRFIGARSGIRLAFSICLGLFGQGHP